MTDYDARRKSVIVWILLPAPSIAEDFEYAKNSSKYEEFWSIHRLQGLREAKTFYEQRSSHLTLSFG